MCMKLVATLKLVPEVDQKTALVALMARFNEACNWLAQRAFELQTADKLRLQKLHYAEIRERFSLGSQFAVRVISKVCEAYKRDKTRLPRFRPDGAVPYDQRIYTFKHGLDRLSLSTLDGRVIVPTVIGPYFRAKLEGVRGQADLVSKKGKLFFYVTVEVPEGASVESDEWLGVDLGIRNLATDSDGEHHSGEAVEKVRARYTSLRHRLQCANTPSAKRHLKKLAGKEARFRQIENHRISKAIVSKAQGTGRGVALEDLEGIRERVTVRRSQRSRHGGWAFFQLRQMVTYKSLQAGVKVRIVDPRNTSRTCLQCGHIAKENRRSQSEFRCVECGFQAHADVVGAKNISSRAAVNPPMVSAQPRKKSGQKQVARGGPMAKSVGLQAGDHLPQPEPPTQAPRHHPRDRHTMSPCKVRRVAAHLGRLQPFDQRQVDQRLAMNTLEPREASVERLQACVREQAPGIQAEDG